MDIKPNLLQLKFDDCGPVRDCSSARRVVLKWRRKYFCVLVSNWGEAIGTRWRSSEVQLDPPRGRAIFRELLISHKNLVFQRC